MTGEEIRILFCRGEIFAKDIFLLSDTAYIAARLDELFRHYEHPDENFRYPDFESAPDGVDFGDSFTLDNCEIISRDTRAVLP